MTLIAGILLTLCQPAMAGGMGSRVYVMERGKIVETGTSSVHQRNIFNKQKDFSAIIKELHPKFWQ